MATIVADCNPGEDTVVAALRPHGFYIVQRKRLPVGDYQVSYGDSVVVLIERKTLDDWRSSIIDGRLESQRARADELYKETGVKLIYLLEGGGVPNWSTEYVYGVQNKALAASILMTSLRDGHHVVATSTLASTAATIAHVAAQLASGGLTPKPASVAAAGILGKRPRDIRATLPPLVAPLAAITGVSLETAELLASKYASASTLIATSVDELADTTLKSGRRVGHVVAKRVKSCFC
jgi:ERCC4-type nuclease